MQNKKNEKINIKEMIKDPKMRGYVFFGFYFIFFLVLVIGLRTGGSKTPVDKDNIKVTPTPTVTSPDSVVDSRNFQYIYTVKEDANTIIYNGKAYQTKELFNIIKDGKTSQYYRLGDNYLRKEKDTYQVSTNPYLYDKFFDLTLLDKLLDGERPTRKENNTSYYDIEAMDIFSIYYPDVNYDGFSISDVGDSRIAITENQGKISKVELSLDSFIAYYSLYISPKHKTLQIILEYYDFNNVKDFEIVS